MVTQLALQSRVIILMHTCEEVLTTNTARLAAKALTNGEVRIHGRRDKRLSADELGQPGRPSLQLFSVECGGPDYQIRFTLLGLADLIAPHANW